MSKLNSFESFLTSFIDDAARAIEGGTACDLLVWRKRIKMLDNFAKDSGLSEMRHVTARLNLINEALIDILDQRVKKHSEIKCLDPEERDALMKRAYRK